MNFRLLVFLVFVFFAQQASAVPFLKNIQLSTYEYYNETLRVLTPEDDPTLVASYRFTIDITASIDASEAALFDEDTSFDFTVGDFSFEGQLGDDEEFDSTVEGKNQSASFDFNVFDVNTEDFRFGRVTFNWSTLDTLKIQVVFNTATPDEGTRYFDAFGQPDYVLWAYRNATSEAPNEDITETNFAELQFGNYSQASLTYFVHGTSSLIGEDSLIRVELRGGTDSLLPTSSITNPGSGVTEVVNSPMILEGKTADKYRVGLSGSTITIPNPFPPKVEYILTDSEQLPANPVWLMATTGPSPDANGNWSWQTPSPVDLSPGYNYLFTRFKDVEGNVLLPTYRRFRFATRGTLTLTGASTDFTVGDNGKTIGYVTGSGALFRNPKKINVIANASPSPLSDTRNNVDAGLVGTVIAKPGSTAIFNGWTAKVENVAFALDTFEAGKEKYTFFSRPKLTLIGNFVPNPFLLGGPGSYFGITDGSFGDFGTFSGNLSKTGAFSGKFKIGKLTIPVKGKFLGSGIFNGKVTYKGVTYTVLLNATVNPANTRQITGTLTGGSINATLVSDLSPWKSRVNEATTYMGNYNVLLPATGTVPAGIGYARVAISKLGKVKVVGKAGNAEALSFSSVFFKRSDNDAGFPFVASLAKKTGVIAGTVKHDTTQPNSDLTGTLEWFKPATLKVEPAQIDGLIALQGSKYQPVSNGSLVILAPSGAGTLALSAPSFITPPVGALVSNSAAVTLQLDHALGAVPDSATVQNTKLKFSPVSGFFTGRFFDPVLRKTYTFGGIASQKANAGNGHAAGLFTRGNRTGKVELTPTPVP